MTNPHERLRSTEHSRRGEAHDAAPSALLTPVQVEQVFRERSESLSSIEADIGAALYDALHTKIEYEKTYLFTVIESNAKVTETKKRLNRILKSEYFVQKPLDTHI
ncbi:hypothetical protein HYT05_02240 [Candidatus Kaiserbacteria bacterium]|nr:hypothetical protein [Candidatus Kaiserbacteria bacterium]